ncbi:MAG: hypothetical protein GY705_21550 [Bacteroidetes bacterium]|nr:hypothetical protein [Bacteroidota bacterium]
MKQLGKGFTRVSLCCAAAVTIAAIGTKANASECYHHFNDQAWEGDGMAIVFCLNSGDLNVPEDMNQDGESHPMKACEVRNRKGKKLMDWYPHIATDHDRQIFTDWETAGWQFGGIPLDIVCTGVNNKTYTFRIPSSMAWADPGTCPKYSATPYQGGKSCNNDHNPILTVTKSGIGTGTVTGNVAGDVKGKIDCGTKCSEDWAHYQFFSKKKVTLTAKPDAGYAFFGWQGACEGSGKCELTMNSDKTVTAIFKKPRIGPILRLLGEEKK